MGVTTGSGTIGSVTAVVKTRPGSPGFGSTGTAVSPTTSCDAAAGFVSSSARALAADDLAERGRDRFDHVEVVDDPVAAVARAHELGEPVLVTGSLYLLGDLAQAEQRSRWRA